MNDKLIGHQHGFIKGRSTETAVHQAISLAKLIKRNLNYTSIDFQGAFDNLQWFKSIYSLHTLNLSQQLINVISSFLVVC